MRFIKIYATILKDCANWYFSRKETDMQKDLLETMCGMFRASGVQVLLLPDLKPSARFIDYEFRSKIWKGYDYAVTSERVERLVSPGTLYQIQDDLLLHYALFCFPETENGQTEEAKGKYLVVGPVLFHPISSREFKTLIDNWKIPKNLENDVMEFFNRIPIPMPFDTWSNTLFYFLSQLCGTPLEYRLLSSNEFELFQVSYADYEIPLTSDVAQDTIENRYLCEAEMINAVSAGNTEEAIKAHSKFRQYKLLPRTPDPLRNQKNMMIILNTLLRKAAQAGSVHPLHIDNLSRQFAVKIEAVTSLAQLDSLANTMLRKYCMLVNNYSRKSYSALIQTCMNYVDFHYMEDLSLNRLAAMSSVSGSYLSASFKKEVGITLTDYINSTRIRQSLILLNTTGLSIQEIASRCGFSDSNYYARTFKKLQGISPKGYRESIRR